MKTRRFIIAGATIVLFATGIGCGKKESAESGSTETTSAAAAAAPKTGSCRQDSAGQCTDYAAAAWEAYTSPEEQCKVSKGVFSGAACPTAKRVGSCDVGGGHV